MTSAKIATAVAYHQAAYCMELAKHSSHAAMEMEHTSRAIQQYILGAPVDTVTDVDPFAGQVEAGGPPEYSSYAYPLGSDHWPATYPIGAPLEKPRYWKRGAQR